jgi:hypothetical protein
MSFLACIILKPQHILFILNVRTWYIFENFMSNLMHWYIVTGTARSVRPLVIGMHFSWNCWGHMDQLLELRGVHIWTLSYIICSRRSLCEFWDMHRDVWFSLCLIASMGLFHRSFKELKEPVRFQFPFLRLFWFPIHSAKVTHIWDCQPNYSISKRTASDRSPDSAKIGLNIVLEPPHPLERNLG